MVFFKAMLNEEEKEVFEQVYPWAQVNKMRLNPQVSMGEFLEARDCDHKSMVFGAFNPRRVDILVSDWRSNPLFVIEHQGSGHKKGNWRLHDAIKHRILGIAGLPLVETVKGEPDEVVHGRLDEALAEARARSRKWRSRKSGS